MPFFFIALEITLKLEDQIKEIGSHYYQHFLENDTNTPLEVMASLEAFADVLRSGDAAIGRPPLRSKIIGKTNLAWLFKLHIDPLLISTITTIIEISPEIKNVVKSSNNMVGFTDGNHSSFVHNPQYLKDLGDLLLMMERIIDTQYDYGPLFKEAATVYQIGYLCLTLRDVALKLFPAYQLCSFCFRVAHETSKYCASHMSSNNADYKHALKTIKLLDKNFTAFKSEFVLRKSSFGEKAYYSNLTDDVEVSDLTSKYVYGSTVIIDGYFGAINDAFSKDWRSLPELMLLYAKQTNECIYRLILGAYSSSSSWEKFCSNFHDVLNNKKEDTENPIWVYHIFVMSLCWFEAEKRRLDGLKKRDLVIMEKTKVTNKSPKEIALELGITQQAVTSRLRMLKQKGYIPLT